MSKRQHTSDLTPSLILCLFLTVITIFCGVYQLLFGRLSNAGLALLTLALFTVPSLFERFCKIRIPEFLKSTLYLFTFSAEILGEIGNFYELIPFWDTLLHVISGFLCAAIGFALVPLLNSKLKLSDFSPFFLTIAALCFSLTIGIFWEFFEFGADSFLHTDMQKDRIVSSFSSVTLDKTHTNKPIRADDIDSTAIFLADGTTIALDGHLDIGLIDTMKDLLVNLLGALVFCLLAFLCLRSKKPSKTLPLLSPLLITSAVNANTSKT